MIRDTEFYRESVPWMTQGNCTDPSIDPEWFFPQNEIQTNPETKLALKMCETCPVRMECLAYAINNYPIDGIWGGMRHKQLKDIVRQLKEQR